MFIIVRGGSGSGKSNAAEDLSIELSEGVRPVYLATMENLGKEASLRIERHRKAREGKGFITVEKSRDIGSLTFTGRTVLLESLSDLLANEMFGPDGEITDYKELCHKIINDIIELYSRCKNLVLVTDNVFCDGDQYSDQTQDYKTALGFLHRHLSAMADNNYEITAGLTSTLPRHESYTSKDLNGAVLILGGAFQGKKDFALQCDPANERILKPDLNTFVKDCLIDSKDPFREIDSIIDSKPDVIIISTQEGCGIIPIERTQRDYRDTLGKVQVHVAQRAGHVFLITSGIAQKLK